MPSNPASIAPIRKLAGRNLQNPTRKHRFCLIFHGNRCKLLLIFVCEKRERWPANGSTKETMPNSSGWKNDAHTYCNSMTTKTKNQLTSARLRAPLCIALALAGLLRPTTVAQEAPSPPGPGTINVEIIYDNTASGTDSVPKFPPTPSNEKGNEIVLCEGSRNVFRFLLFYYGDFVAEGDETCTLRFYANDGEAFHPDAPQFLQPGTLLYESDPTPIEPGDSQAILFTDINVEVPDRFTWTAEFDGLSGLSGDLASLIFYDVPMGWDSPDRYVWENPADAKLNIETYKTAVGGSMGYYWEKSGDQWNYTIGRSGPVNFAAGIHAHPEDSVRILLTPSDDKIILQGPTGKTVLLEISHDQQNWRLWEKIDLPPCGRLPLRIDENFPRPRYFRVQGVEDTEIRLDVIAMREDGRMELAASGPNGVSFQVQATADFENWRTVGEYTFSTRSLLVKDVRAAEADFQFYRILLSSSPE